MQELQYQGEHLWVQYLGKAFLILALISALYTAIISIWSYNKKDEIKSLFQKWSKYGLIFHHVALLSVIGLILFMMVNHYFEFHYVWEHVSDDLSMKYIMSAFWEGQEGSFLLWMFWNAFICWLLLNHRNFFSWMNVGIIMIVQVILLSMIMGLYIFDFKVGSNPFLLLRQTMDIPLFKNPAYVSLVKGNGLNPLLQNYWMLIHPPTLFLGFASTVIPFAYALSGLITKKYEEWLKPCLKWTLFSASILGLGILMGGIWAYEALSFGGYWAWDPVENMSLVPWLVLIGGLHAHLIAQATKYSIRASIIFYFITYSLVIYSTYLTRSGVLGDSSVHAFTGLGLGWQLVGFIIAIIIVPLYYLIKERKNIPIIKEEEKFFSREFWMFIGSLILLFSAGLITFTTSIPVYNKLLDFFGSLLNIQVASYHKSAPVDVIGHHNKYQIWIAVVIALLSGTSLLLRYVGQRKIVFVLNSLRSLIFSIIIAGIGAYLIGLYLDKKNVGIYVLLFSALFALVTNFNYLFKAIKERNKSYSSALSHMGFGILLLGIILTGVNKRNIVPEKFFQEDSFFQEDDASVNKHFLLFKNDAKFAKGYWMNYMYDTLDGRFRRYKINMSRVDSSNHVQDEFELHPDIQYDNKLTKVAAANPYIKHYWNKDLFSLIAQIPKVQMDATEAAKAEDSLKFITYSLKLNDTVFGRKYFYILQKINTHFQSKQISKNVEDLGIQLEVLAGGMDSTREVLKPGIIFKPQLAYRFPFNQDKLGIRIEIADSLASTIANYNQNNPIKKFSLKESESFTSDEGISFKLIGFDKNPKDSSYVPEEGDIAIGAQIEVQMDGKNFKVEPIYLIREQRELSLPYINYSDGISIRFTHVNPSTGSMDFDYSRLSIPSEIPVQIAENVPRTDYIVMEIIEFPGISLVWIGSLIMIFGLALSSYNRRK